jgi:hypothetical protein
MLHFGISVAQFEVCSVKHCVSLTHDLSFNPDETYELEADQAKHNK